MWRLLTTALGRGSRSSDAMREAAAQTTVILLAQNEKFELFMRQKVEELQARVTAQGARLSTAGDVEVEDLFDEFPESERLPTLESSEEAALSLDEVPVTEPAPEEAPDYLALMREEPAEQIETGWADARTGDLSSAVISLADQSEPEATDEAEQNWETPLSGGQKDEWA